MIQLVVFHTGVESLPKYLPLMRIGKAELAKTTPGARYVVLTDKETARHLDKEFEVAALAPSGMKLMPQYVSAQLAYEKQADGLVIHADSDCIPNYDLARSLRHPMAI